MRDNVRFHPRWLEGHSHDAAVRVDRNDQVVCWGKIRVSIVQVRQGVVAAAVGAYVCVDQEAVGQVQPRHSRLRRVRVGRSEHSGEIGETGRIQRLGNGRLDPTDPTIRGHVLRWRVGKIDPSQQTPLPE